MYIQIEVTGKKEAGNRLVVSRAGHSNRGFNATYYYYHYYYHHHVSMVGY